MSPREIARFITDDPDIFSEGWEEVDIEDPGLEDPVENALERAQETCWAMLMDKTDRPKEELEENIRDAYRLMVEKEFSPHVTAQTKEIGIQI